MKSIVFLLILLIVTGCSGKKSTAKMEISLGFATANSNFDGGLFIHGKNSTSGEEFSFALGSQTSTSIDLNYGIWDIRVIGWDNTTNIFEGDVLCASERIDFKKEEQRVAIQVTNAKCNNTVFASNNFISLNSGITSFNPLTIITCGALYDLSNPTQLHPATGAAVSCDSYPKEFRKQAKSLSYTLHNKLPNGQLTNGLTSGCITPTAGTGTFVTNKLLPTKIPVTISFFESNNCSVESSLDKMHFPQGIENTLTRSQQGHDAVLNQDSSTLQLALPISNRGTTPFLTERPFLECNSTTPQKCLSLPLIPTGYHFVFKSGMTYTISFPGTITCSGLTLTSDDTDSDSIQDIIYDDYCLNKGAETLLGVKVQNIQDLTSINFSINGQSYIGQIQENPFAIHENILPYLGYNQTARDISGTLYKNRNNGMDTNKSGGILAEISEMLSPIYAGGLFWDSTCTATPVPSPITRTVQLWEEGEEKNFTITLTNPPNINTPRYINSTDPKSTTDQKVFNRRLILRKFHGVAVGYKTSTIMDFACDGQDALDITSGNSNLRIGRMEEFHQEFDEDFSEKREERKLIFWNTTAFNNSRFEVYKHELLENTLYNLISREKSSFTRVEKLPNATSLNSALRMTDLTYNYNLDGAQTIADTSDAVPIEEIKHKQFDIKENYITVTDMGELGKSSGQGDIFQGSMNLFEKNRIRYGIQNVDNHVVSLPSGKFLHAYIPEINSMLIIDRFDGTAYSQHTDSISGLLQVTSDLSPDGNKAIVASTSASGITLNLYNGTSWLKTSMSFPHNTTSIKAVILNSGEYMLAATVDTGTIYYTLGDMTNLPTSISPASFYTNTTTDIFLAKDNNKFWFFHNNSTNIAPTNYSKDLTYCNLSYSNQTCSLTTLYNWSGTNAPAWDIANLSVQTNPDLSIITYSYINTQNNSHLSFSSPTIGTPMWTPIDNLVDSTFIANSISIEDIDMTDPHAIGNNTHVNVPYIQPIVPNFQMNFISLKPSNMINNVFTNKTVFENTSN